MNISKTIISTAVALSVTGAIGFAFAQTNQQNINVKPQNNLTQIQSDGALPCQPTPFNPHLPRDGKRTSNTTSNTIDCATPVTRAVTVQTETRYAAPVVVVQTEATQPTYSGNTSISAAVEPAYIAPANDPRIMSSERMPRDDRN